MSIPRELWKGFIFLDNYKKAFTDRQFYQALGNTVIWVGESVILQFVIGLGTALVLNQKFRGRAIVRGAVMIPWATPLVVTTVLWSWIYHPNIGVLNDLLMRLGVLEVRASWLADPNLALHLVALTQVWTGFPFFAIMLLAALQSIPTDMYEAAKIDGASISQSFKNITIPLLKGQIFVVIMLRVIWLSQNAMTIFLMTAGGPAGSTQVLASYTFLVTLTHLNFGYASALGVILFLILLLLIYIYIKVGRVEI